MHNNGAYVEADVALPHRFHLLRSRRLFPCLVDKCCRLLRAIADFKFLLAPRDLSQHGLQSSGSRLIFFVTRDSPWMKLIGADYIELAFQAARARCLN